MPRSGDGTGGGGGGGGGVLLFTELGAVNFQLFCGGTTEVPVWA